MCIDLFRFLYKFEVISHFSFSGAPDLYPLLSKLIVVEIYKHLEERERDALNVEKSVICPIK